MAQARQAIIAAQSQFYRDGFRKIVFMLFVLMIIAYALLGLIVYLYITRPAPQYFVTTSSGRLIEIMPTPIESLTPAAPPPAPTTPVAPAAPVAPP